MNTLLISYDLNTPGQDYAQLHEKIKSLGAWCHSLESTWIVTTSYTPVQVRDSLVSTIDRNDELLVMDLSGIAAWHGLSIEVSNWLKTNLEKSLLSRA